MYIASGMGMRWGKMHKGVDIAAGGDSTGKAIVAFADGKVIESKLSGGYGNMVLIDHGNGLQTLYAHMLQKGIAVGTEVKASDPIGLVGSTGHSTGPHVYFEVHINGNEVDPMSFLAKFHPQILGCGDQEGE